MVLSIVVSLPSQQGPEQRGEEGGRVHAGHALLRRGIYNYRPNPGWNEFLGGNRREHFGGIHRSADSVHSTGHRAAHQVHAEGRAGKRSPFPWQ